MELHEIKYKDDGVALTGILADGSNGKLAPGILIAHEALGVGDLVKQRARMLAERGYIAFALDMYGAPDLPLEEAQRRSRALMADAGVMRRRARAALDVLKARPHCDSSRLAVVGFCLGGIVALELARDEAPIRCAVGFHPGFMRPTGSTTGKLSAIILMMIGDDDPIVPSEDRAAFVREMSEARADWQLHIFGGVGHSYTNKAIDALSYPGFAYDETADRRASAYMHALLDEVFASGNNA